MLTNVRSDVLMYQDGLLLAGAVLQLAFLTAAVLEDCHLRRIAGNRRTEADRQPSLACLLDQEQILAEGGQKLISHTMLSYSLSSSNSMLLAQSLSHILVYTND